MPGLHLPLLAAAADGLFAEHGFDVTLLDPAGEIENSLRVANGEADFSLSRITGHVAAIARRGPLAARFVAVVVRRHPISVFVPVGSPVRQPADLSGLRVAGAIWAVREFTAGMAELGLAPVIAVPMSRTSGGGLLQEACGMLARGEVDAVADYEDLLPRARRHSGLDVRSVPLGLELYSSGIVASDRLPDDLVARFVTAFIAAYERQRAHPDLGLAEVVARCPRVVPDDAREGWRIVEPRIFTGERPGSIDAERWTATVAYSRRAVECRHPSLEEEVRTWRTPPPQALTTAAAAASPNPRPLRT